MRQKIAFKRSLKPEQHTVDHGVLLFAKAVLIIKK